MYRINAWNWLEGEKIVKRILALLCGVLLVGCGNANAPTTEDKLQQVVNNEQTSQNDTNDKDNMQDDLENSEEHSKEENSKEESSNKDDLKEDTSQAVDEIEIGESADIHIETKGFVENMDKIFTDLEEYEGKTLSYEGVLIKTEESGDQYAVVRTHEVSHGDHTHSIYVGLETAYDGEWPEVNSWVKVSGTIQKANTGGEDYPVLQINEIEVMPEVGDLNVID